MITVKWWDKATNKSCCVVVNNDVLEVQLPAQEASDGGLPALAVHVNTDGVAVEKIGGGLVARYEFHELLADAEGDI
jgi:hypothetical protein